MSIVNDESVGTELPRITRPDAGSLGEGGQGAAASPVIEVSGLRVAYGDNLVLDGIDLRVEPGEVVVILGPNGVGKTTTIEILEGLRHPSSGAVEVLGVTPWRADEAWRAKVGIVLQTWRDHAKWRVRELLEYLGGYYEAYSTAHTPRPWPVDDLLGLVGLGKESDKRISRLSGGQRRRLDIAAGIVGRPDVLFLDEPTAGFDPVARSDFHDLLLSLADQDVTVVMTTHDLDEASKVASRIVVLAERRIIANGSPDAIRRMNFGKAEVIWFDGHARQVHATDDPAAFLRELLARPGAVVEDLEVRRASLEAAYIELVERAEGGAAKGGRRFDLAGESPSSESEPAPSGRAHGEETAEESGGGDAVGRGNRKPEGRALS
ncbi:MAG: ABC transporter ATP-binding protein [Actinomycetaceae bacterium]|nr:ABC transporter ATP-binding protein [Actinomycetaceae bacterium]